MVYRPPKSKPLPSRGGAAFPANRPDADPLEGPLQQPAVSGDPRAGDDRNLILVDHDLSEADFEDRLWLFWQRRRQIILWGITLALALAAVWQGWHYVQRSQVRGLQEAYLAAAGGGQAGLQAFGREKSATPLGKVALIEAADMLYKTATDAASYNAAAAAYDEAAAAWGATEATGQRAQFGAAMARVRAGGESLAAGRAALEAIANDFQLASNWRGQALFFLISLDLQAGNVEGARNWNNRFQTVPAPLWSSASQRLLEGAALLAAAPAAAAGSPAPVVPSPSGSVGAPAEPPMAEGVTPPAPPSAPEAATDGTSAPVGATP